MTQTGITQVNSFRDLTDARLTLGPRGRALDTASSLRFAVDHAQAREAVLSELDIERIARQLEAAGLAHETVTSAAGTRDTYIRRPDLGRRLADDARERLGKMPAADVALVLGDGLSAIAAALNGPALMIALAERLKVHKIPVTPVILARQARVALGDDIAAAMGAPTVIMALGERPGLSAADSLGVYITHRPDGDEWANTADSDRICISNIREGGLTISEAVSQAERIILAMRSTGLSGVGLNQALAAGRLPDLDT